MNIPGLRAFQEGRFAEAYSLLRREIVSSDEALVLLVEAQHFLGHYNDAASQAARLLSTGRLSPLHQSRCVSVLADLQWYAGRLSTALELYHRAAALAERSNVMPWLSRATAILLERMCDQTGYDSSLPLAVRVRRYAANSGDFQLSAQVHLTFGRLESRIGHFDAARRHFELARRLLEVEPNVYLLASVFLDEACLQSLIGDFVLAVELAERGALLADQSGWLRGRMAAAVTLAHLYVSLGEVENANRQLRVAERQPFCSAEYELALSDTKARAAIACGKYALAQSVLESVRLSTSESQTWYVLTVEQTRAALKVRVGEYAEALELANQCIALARKANLRTFEAAFMMCRYEAEMALGNAARAQDLPIDEALDNWPLSLVGYLHGILGRALVRAGSLARGDAQTSRARRILRSAGDLIALETIGTASEPSSSPEVVCRVDCEAPALGRTDLDSAVALLELAGHPRILGHEAFALLQDSRCTEALALVATGGAVPRVIAAHGWPDEEALAALGAAEPADLMPVGRHRDETWALLARPRPGLDDRCTIAAIRKLIATAVSLDEYRRDEKQRAALWPAEALEADPDSIWASEQAAELLTTARRIASNPLPVLLTGETGTGKEMLARAIHRASDRANRQMLPFNCSAVPRDMLESQLFGYRKGAFTGADVSFPGVIRSAAGSTLFLDEIADIGLELQPKLLRFLEYQEVHPLGEPHPIQVDVRIIAATNANLEQLVAEGRFREDLFYRLKVMHLIVPPLRQRREEIPTLVQHYIRRYSEEQKKGRLVLSDEALEYLLLYAWPGNIRQLANEVRRMVALAEPDSTLAPALLSPEIQASRRTIPAPAGPNEPEIRLRLDQPLPAAVELLEQTMVRRALKRSHGRVEQAARLLGISRKGLFLKRRRWGIDEAAS